MTEPTTFTTLPSTPKAPKAPKAKETPPAPDPQEEAAAPPPAPAKVLKKRGPKQPLSQEALDRLAAARTKAVEVRRVKAEERRAQVAAVMDRLMREKELKLEARVRNDLERERVRKIAEARTSGRARQVIVEDPESDASEDEMVDIPPPRTVSRPSHAAPMAAPHPSTIVAPRRNDAANLRRFLF